MFRNVCNINRLFDTRDFLVILILNKWRYIRPVLGRNLFIPSTYYVKARFYSNFFYEHCESLSTRLEPTDVFLTSNDRTSRKKRSNLHCRQQNKRHRGIYGFATAEGYNLEALYMALFQNHVYHPHVLSGRNTYVDSTDAMYAEARYVIGDELRFMYLFRHGAAVFWNMTDIECLNILNIIKRYESFSYNKEAILQEQEYMTYSYTAFGKRTTINNGHIRLASNVPPEHHRFDLYTISDSIARSVKLGIQEFLLERYISSMSPVTRDLSSGTSINLSQKDALCKIGELYDLKNSINLSLNTLEIRDVYWGKFLHQKLFRRSSRFLAVDERTKVMNKKLRYCMDLILLLKSQLSDAHHVRLEWMIIVLIFLDIIIELIINKHMFKDLMNFIRTREYIDEEDIFYRSVMF